jgi:hypothetical protein
MTPLDAVYRPSPHVSLRRFGDEAVAITTHDSRVHELNETAAALLVACDGPLSGRVLVDRLAVRFDAAGGGLEADVAAFLGVLVEAGLLARDD